MKNGVYVVACSKEKMSYGYGDFMIETWEEERKKVRGEVSVKRE